MSTQCSFKRFGKRGFADGELGLSGAGSGGCGLKLGMGSDSRTRQQLLPYVLLVWL